MRNGFVSGNQARTELRAVPVEGGESRSISGDFADELGNSALSDARDPFAAQPIAIIMNVSAINLVWHPSGSPGTI